MKNTRFFTLIALSMPLVGSYTYSIMQRDLNTTEAQSRFFVLEQKIDGAINIINQLVIKYPKIKDPEIAQALEESKKSLLEFKSKIREIVIALKTNGLRRPLPLSYMLILEQCAEQLFAEAEHLFKQLGSE